MYELDTRIIENIVDNKYLYFTDLDSRAVNTCSILSYQVWCALSLTGHIKLSQSKLLQVLRYWVEVQSRLFQWDFRLFGVKPQCERPRPIVWQSYNDSE